MIHDTDYDKGDWEHEVKRDKALDRLAELETRIAALEPKPEPAPESAYVVFEPGDLFIGFFRDKDAAQRLIDVRPKTYVVEYVRAALQEGE